jgi:spore germination protein KA
MSVLKFLKNLLQYQPPKDDVFILEEGTWAQEAERAGEIPHTEQKAAAGSVAPRTEQGGDTGAAPGAYNKTDTPEDAEATTAPQPTAQREKRPERTLRKPVPISEKLTGESPEDRIAANLDANRSTLERLFHKPQNTDLVIRDFTLQATGQCGLLVYIEGIVNSDRLSYSVLQPLMLLGKARDTQLAPYVIETVEEHLMPVHQVAIIETWAEVIQNLVDGLALLFVDGDARALAIEARNFPSRAIGRAEVETVVQGPQEAFSENKRVNVSLVRNYLRNKDLITESVDIGSGNSAFVLYIAGVANQKLVDEVRRRLSSLEGSFLREPGHIEQMIEDHPNSLYPQTLTTERPDRVAIHLMQGKIAVILDGSPFALIVPITFFTLIKTPEDSYLRPAFGTLLRIVRVAAIFVAYLLPGIYLAIVEHHHAILPSDLLLAIAGSREGVPFPSWLEVVMMEVSFEVIREAGIRVPGVIGPTLGIVSALVLGQAAVAAAVASPILIIIVATTALAAFAIPNYQLQFSTRIIRFLYIAIGYALGLYGIVLGLAVQIFYTTSITSFGVGYLSPVAPSTKTDLDIVFRSPLWLHETRPDYLQSPDRVKKPRISRGWMQEDNHEKK